MSFSFLKNISDRPPVSYLQRSVIWPCGRQKGTAQNSHREQHVWDETHAPGTREEVALEGHLLANPFQAYEPASGAVQ